MTTAEMLAKLGMMLDETAAAFWTDVQKYEELAEGQNEIVKMALDRMWGSMEVPFVLSKQVKSIDVSTVSLAYYALQADELYTIAIKYDQNGGGTKYPCRLLGVNRNVDYDIDNTFSAPTASDPIAEFRTVSTTAGWYFNPATTGSFAATTKYIKEPADIASGTEPELPSTAHNAIVQFAFATLLSKDEDTTTRARSTEELQKFYKMVETLLGEHREDSEPELKIQMI